MGDFYITLQSDSSPDHFPDNTISDFRNQFSIPVKLDSDQYQVALVECSYVHSSIVIKKGEKLCKYYDKEYFASMDFHSVEDAINSLRIPKKDFEIKGKFVYVPILPTLIKAAKDSADGMSRVDFPDSYVFWEPKIATMLGFDDFTLKYEYPVFSKASRSLLYVYCNIVESQRVGSNYVPLLRKMINNGKNHELTTREFAHLQYIDVIYDEFDSIHMYIRTENGQAPSFDVGTFSATLHFRRKRY